MALTVAPVPACSTFDEQPTGPSGEAGPPDGACSTDLQSDPANCGSCGVACSAEQLCDTGQCVPGCRQKILHVSKDTGSDANDGCSIAKPMRSIGAAVARAKALGMKKHAIHVCRGTYVERALVLDYPVSLRGGYECTTFQRPPDFGFPSFGAATSTAIEEEPPSAPTASGRSTLQIKGAAVDGSVLVDGFTIRGPAGAGTGSALTIYAKAAPVIRDLDVRGGATTASVGIGSLGIFVLDASPDVISSRVNGGSGTAQSGTDPDSVGVWASGESAPRLENVIVGGGDPGAKVPRASYGAIVTAGAKIGGSRAWKGVAAAGGKATSRSEGLLVSAKASLELTESVAVGGELACADSNCAGFGVEVADGAVDIVRCLIGGADSAPSGLQAGGVAGIYAEVGKVDVTNSIVFSGNASRRNNTTTVALSLFKVASPRLVHNAFITVEAPTSGSSIGIVANSVTNAELVNNLIVSNDQVRGAGIRVETNGCQTATGTFDQVASKVANNAFVGFATLASERTGVACVVAGPETTVAGLEAALGATVASKNVRLASSCGGDTSAACATCRGSPCAADVFDPWTSGSPRVDELLAPGSYKARAGGPCLVFQGGQSIPGIPADRTEKPRTGAVSIGPAELEGCTPP